MTRRDRTHQGAKTPSQRQLRVGEELRHILARIFERGDIHDPELSRIQITVTEVRASPDLRNATVYVTPLGGGDAGPLLAALERARGFLQHELSRQVRLKFMPRLAFAEDTSFDTATHMNRLFHDPAVMRDLEDGDAKAEDEDGA